MTTKPSFHCHRTRTPAVIIFPIVCLVAVAPIGCDAPTRSSGPSAGVRTKTEDLPATVFCAGLIDVEGGVIPLAAPRGGIVAALPVVEGARVIEGQPILRLVDEADRLTIEAAASRLRGAEEAAGAAGAEPERFRLQIQQGEEQLEASRARLLNVRMQLDTTRQLAELKQAGRLDVLTAEARVDEATHALAAEKARLDALRLADPTPRLAEANRQVEAARIALREAEWGGALSVLRAPCDGAILRVSAVPAGSVSAGQTLVIIQPDAPLVARVPLDPEFAGFVRVGSTAEVRPESNAGSSKPWKGRVSSMGGWYAVRRPVGQEVVPPNESRSLECVVVLEENGGEKPRVGLGVEVRIGIATGLNPSDDDSDADDDGLAPRPAGV